MEIGIAALDATSVFAESPAAAFDAERVSLEGDRSQVDAS